MLANMKHIFIKYTQTTCWFTFQAVKFKSHTKSQNYLKNSLAADKTLFCTGIFTSCISTKASHKCDIIRVLFKFCNNFRACLWYALCLSALPIEKTFSSITQIQNYGEPEVVLLCQNSLKNRQVRRVGLTIHLPASCCRDVRCHGEIDDAVF